MLEFGFVKLHRSMLSWEWYTDANTMRLFLHLILTANYEDKKWQGKLIERGQRVTSYPQLSQELRLSIQEIRTALNHLKSTGELTVTTYSRYSVISINNYEKYQELTDNLTGNQQTANSQSTVNQQAINNNERNIRKQESKKDKNIKEKIYKKENLCFESVPPALLDDIVAYTEHRKEIKAPMSQRALTLLVNELNKLSSDIDEQREILNQSILNGWKGVFPLKKGEQYDNRGNNGATNQKADDEFQFSTVINYDE